MRDCANCFHRKPVLKEDGTWTAECEKWDCEFQSRENMIEKTEAKGGDLISREALKKDFKERLAKCDEWIEKAKDKETKIRASAVKAFIAEVIMTIDNAPTVELTESEVQEVLNKRCMTAVANEYLIALHGKTERPQGEWIVLVDADNIQTCKCSICGRMVDIANREFDKFPYCHCGAKMKGGAE